MKVNSVLALCVLFLKQAVVYVLFRCNYRVLSPSGPGVTVIYGAVVTEDVDPEHLIPPPAAHDNKSNRSKGNVTLSSQANKLFNTPVNIFSSRIVGGNSFKPLHFVMENKVDHLGQG